METLEWLNKLSFTVSFCTQAWKLFLHWATSSKIMRRNINYETRGKSNTFTLKRVSKLFCCLKDWDAADFCFTRGLLLQLLSSSYSHSEIIKKTIQTRIKSSNFSRNSGSHFMAESKRRENAECTSSNLQRILQYFCCSNRWEKLRSILLSAKLRAIKRQQWKGEQGV